MTDTMDPATETMNGTMKAVSQDELGGPDVLKLVTVPTPEPGISEILIRVHAAGVNPIDGAQRQTGAFVGQPPFVLGWDLCGAVEAVGPGVTLYQPGDVVFGMLPFPQGHGAYAQYAVGPTRVFVRKPDRLDHVHAAAIPMVGLTAWQALVDTAGVGAGSRVLINGAAGGIGHLAVQIAKARGAHVIASARPGDEERHVRDLGADEAVDWAGGGVAEAVRAAHPEGIDTVIDLVTGDPEQLAALCRGVLREGGSVATTLNAGDPALLGSITATNVWSAPEMERLELIAQLAGDGALRPPVTDVYDFADLADAFAAVGRGALGKVAVRLDGAD